MNKLFKKQYKALSVVEIVVAIAVLAILSTSGFVAYRLSLRAVTVANLYSKAEILAVDLVDLAVSKRNESWNSLTPGEYYFAEDELLGIVFVAGQETIEAHTRWVEISEVYRDGTGFITESGGTLDPDSMKVTAHVTWNHEGENKELTISQYLTNWKRF